MRQVFIVLIGLLLALYWSFVSVWLLQSLGPPQEVLGIEMVPAKDAYLVLMSCIWPAIWEELLYRYGPIKIAKSFNKPEIIWPVILMSSAMFGWGHLDGHQGVFIQGIIGILLSFIYLKTNQIWLCMLIHAIYNTLITFGPIWLQ